MEFKAPIFLASQSNRWLSVLAAHWNHAEAFKNPDAWARPPEPLSAELATAKQV